MAKEATRTEVMAPLSPEEVAALAAKAGSGEVVVKDVLPPEVKLPHQEVVYLDGAGASEREEPSNKDDLAGKKKGSKVAKADEKSPEIQIQADLVLVRYTGNNPSYTLGRYRFRKNEVVKIEKELAAYALEQGCFILEV